MSLSIAWFAAAALTLLAGWAALRGSPLRRGLGLITAALCLACLLAVAAQAQVAAWGKPERLLKGRDNPEIRHVVASGDRGVLVGAEIPIIGATWVAARTPGRPLRSTRLLTSTERFGTDSVPGINEAGLAAPTGTVQALLLRGGRDGEERSLLATSLGAAGWSERAVIDARPPERLAIDSATDERGNGVAVTVDKEQGSARIFESTRAREVWHLAAEIDGLYPPGVELRVMADHQIANRYGVAAFAWAGVPDYVNLIYRRAGGSWQGPVTLTAHGAKVYSELCDLAIAPSGQIALLYKEFSGSFGSRVRLLTRTFDPARKTVGQPRRIWQRTDTEARRADRLALAAGRAGLVAAWVEEELRGPSVTVAQSRGLRGGYDKPRILARLTRELGAEGIDDIEVASLPSGGVMAAWIMPTIRDDASLVHIGAATLVGSTWRDKLTLRTLDRDWPHYYRMFIAAPRNGKPTLAYNIGFGVTAIERRPSG